MRWVQHEELKGNSEKSGRWGGHIKGIKKSPENTPLVIHDTMSLLIP